MCRERLGAVPIWDHVVLTMFAKVGESREPSVFPDFSPLVSPFTSSSTCHLVPISGGTCLLFSGAWVDSDPLANLAKPPSVWQLRQRTHLRPGTGLGGRPSAFHPTSSPWCAFWPRFSSPRLLATSAETVSRTEPPGLCAGGGRCVLPVQGEEDRNVCDRLNASQRKDKVQPCKTQGDNICAGEETEKQGKKNRHNSYWRIDDAGGVDQALPLCVLFLWTWSLEQWCSLGSFLLELTHSSLRVPEGSSAASVCWEEVHVGIMATDPSEANKTRQKSGTSGPSLNGTQLTRG